MPKKAETKAGRKRARKRTRKRTRTGQGTKRTGGPPDFLRAGSTAGAGRRRHSASCAGHNQPNKKKEVNNVLELKLYNRKTFRTTQQQS